MSDTPKPLGCDKNIDGDQLAALKDISPSDMKALIDSHAGSEGCKNEIRNSLDTAVSRGQTMDMWLRDSATVSGSIGWSGGSASAGVSMDTGLSTTDTNLSTQASTMSGISSGCRQTLMNINESNSLYSQMTCNIKQASNIAVTNIKMGATISVQVGPTEAQVAAYDRKIAGINDNIARLMNRTEMNEFTIKSLAILNEALERADASFRFDIKNSSFKIDNNNIAKLTSTNNQEIENNTQIREAILKKATSEAITGVTQKFEMGAQASQDLEAYAQSKINDTSLSTTQDIVQAANETKLNVDMNGNITLNINGSLEGTNVVISQGNLTEMRSELIMKAASELGKDVAAEIIHEAITKGSIDTEGTGLASYQKAIADGLAEQAKNLKPGGGGLFGGLFGGIIGKIAMIAIPIVIILVLFSMFGFKIALVAGLIFGIYLAIAYFVGLTPFSKENNEMNSVDEIYDELMNRYILPRRIALFDNFIERLRTERNLTKNWPTEYVSEIDLLISFLDASGKIPTKLTRLGLYSSKTPRWMLATMYNLELDTYIVLINMFEDVASNNGEIFDGLSIDNVRMVLTILKEERDKLGLLFNNIGLIQVESELQDSAWVAALTSVNSNPPSGWQGITSAYQGWLDRGKPTRRNQTAMADSQQAYVASAQATGETGAFSDSSSSIPTGPDLVDFRGYIGPNDTSHHSQWIREVVVPRKTALYENLIDKIKNEYEKIMRLENASVAYIQRLEAGLSFLYMLTSRKDLLLTNIGPLGMPDPPSWVFLTVIKLEMSIYKTLLPFGKTLLNIVPPSQLGPGSLERAQNLIYRGERELKMLMEYLDRASSIATFPYRDEEMFANKMADQVLIDTPGPEDTWKYVITQANNLITMYGGTPPLPSAGISTRAMDTQQAYGAVGQGYAMVDSQQAYAMPQRPVPADIQQAYQAYGAAVGQNFSMADMQQMYGSSRSAESIALQAQPVTYAMAVPQQPPQKGYTKSGKKSHAYGKVAKKSPMYNSNQNSRGMATMGGEILNTVQKEYSRRNPKTVKPVYHKTPDFRPK